MLPLCDALWKRSAILFKKSACDPVAELAASFSFCAMSAVTDLNSTGLLCARLDS
jgi:hypothetical protein